MALFTPPQPAQRSRSVRTSLIAFAAVIGLLYYGRDFFVTLIISLVFAFILDPAVVLVMKLRLPRPAATGIVIAVACIAVYVASALAWAEIATMTEDLPGYALRLNDLWSKANGRLDELGQGAIDVLVPKKLREQSEQIQQKPQEAMKARRKRSNVAVLPVTPVPPLVQEVRIHSDPKPFITTLYSYAAGYIHVLVMASFVPFLVYFMLSWRDHFNQTVTRLFHGRQRYVVGKTWSGIGDSTRAYVLGNFILWILLSCVSAIVYFFLGVPYWMIIAPMSAFCSLVPYVGLPLSILPPVLAAIAIPNRFKIVATLMLVTAGLHIVVMNFVYAKVIGRRVRLNPLVVTVALMFWGMLWGGVGLILAVPITAAIKTVCDNVESLQPYGKLLGD